VLGGPRHAVAELAAAEVVRRAERGGIGLAIRRGQEAGEIRTIDDTRAKGPATAGDPDGTPGDGKRSPAEFFSGAKTRSDTYAMADGVSDDQFDGAIEEAKAEGNLSRANVVRMLLSPPAACERSGACASSHRGPRRGRRPPSPGGRGRPPHPFEDPPGGAGVVARRAKSMGPIVR
jgi:hypothetical protein